jgi:phage I-like protein
MPNSQIIFANALPDDLGSAIMYIPEGSSVIECLVNSKPKKITVNMPAEKGEAIAAGMQAELDQKLADNVRPVFDFDHKGDGPASALPKKFYYQKGRGLMVECEWTGAGKKARRNKDYSYFSPTFLRDEESGEPVGLPNRGPLGALVNDPAFRQIERVAAAKADLKQPNKTKKMTELVTAGLLSKEESEKDNAMTVAAGRVAASAKSIDDLTTERDALKVKVATIEAASAKELVTAAVADGRILSKDTETQEFWTKQIVEAGDSAKAALSAITPANSGITEPVVKAGVKPVEREEVELHGSDLIAAALADESKAAE